MESLYGQMAEVIREAGEMESKMAEEHTGISRVLRSKEHG